MRCHCGRQHNFYSRHRHNHHLRHHRHHRHHHAAKRMMRDTRTTTTIDWARRDARMRPRHGGGMRIIKSAIAPLTRGRTPHGDLS
eukprot:3912336-Pyramimonas_sp.AAC.1